jgi:hypothetical protein
VVGDVGGGRTAEKGGVVGAGDAALLNPVLWSRCQDRHVPVLLYSL